MTDPEIIIIACEEVEELLQSTRLPEPDTLPPISPWIAASLLQKAVRRGLAPLAMAAANTLLAVSPERVWKRLVVIAIEDVGVGGIETVYQTIATACERSRLSKRRDPRHLVALLAYRLAMSTKCRACDDLFLVANEDPSLAPDRMELAAVTDADRYRVVLHESSVQRRALAALQLLTRGGKRTYDDVFFAITEAGAPHTLSNICRRAFSLTREPFTALLPMLWQPYGDQITSRRNDVLPPEALVGGIPGWALDQFSRPGLAALSQFRRKDCSTTRWLQNHVSPLHRDRVLRHGVFRVESGLCSDRLEWKLGLELRTAADLSTWPFPSLQAQEFLTIVREDIPLLNQARVSTYGQ